MTYDRPGTGSYGSAADHLRQEEPAEPYVHPARSLDEGHHHRGQRLGTGTRDGRWKGRLGKAGPDFQQPRYGVSFGHSIAFLSFQ